MTTTVGLTPKVYPLLCTAIEDGVAGGWHRAHKHTDDPTDDDAIETITDYVTNAILEAFDIPDTDTSRERDDRDRDRETCQSVANRMDDLADRVEQLERAALVRDVNPTAASKVADLTDRVEMMEAAACMRDAGYK